MVFRQDGQSENCGQFWSTHPGKTFPSMSIRPNINVSCQVASCNHITSYIYFFRNSIRARSADPRSQIVTQEQWEELCASKLDPGAMSSDELDQESCFKFAHTRKFSLLKLSRNTTQQKFIFKLETHCGADRKVATVKFFHRTRFLCRCRFPSFLLPTRAVNTF